MAVQIVDRAPRTRCYICGDAQIAGLCHHCGRAMCAEHSPLVADGQGFSFSAEFADLNLRQTECPEAPIHCEHCDHAVLRPGFWAMVAGALLVLAGVFLLEDADRWLAVLGGVACAALGVYSYWQRSQIIQQSRPPLPVLPRFERLKVREALNGRVTLGPDGQYHVAIEPLAGQLEIVAIFSKRERDRLDLYREKYRLAEDEEVPFHAGFAVPRGPTGWKFADDWAIRNPSGFVIPLRGMVGDVPFFSDTVSRSMREWRVKHEYSLLETPKDLTLPIRLILSLFQERAQRVLELELQWVAPARSASNMSIQQIKSIELCVPVLWGDIQGASVRVPVLWGDIQLLSDSALIRDAPHTAGQPPMRSITWENLLIKENPSQGARRTFMIQFEHTIDLADTIRGHVDVVFKNTLSGLEGIDLYYPLGGRRSGTEAASIQTTVAIDFELSLAGLRYQDLRMIPDSKSPPSQQQPETCRFAHIIPDHATIIALTDAISQQNFYVQHMIENRPQTMQQADMFNRYWDIAGRYYDGVYPIDFHLILTGEEIHGGGGRARSGATEVTLAVQGAYANPDMEQQIEHVWERLWVLIKETMCARVQPSNAADGAAERAVGD